MPMPDVTVYKVIIYRHIVSPLTKTAGNIEHADSITKFTALLFIYLHIYLFTSKLIQEGFKT
jgi:hypothetical protein